jgi:hypothetical protein
MSEREEMEWSQARFVLCSHCRLRRVKGTQNAASFLFSYLHGPRTFRISGDSALISHDKTGLIFANPRAWVQSHRKELLLLSNFTSAGDDSKETLDAAV